MKISVLLVLLSVSLCLERYINKQLYIPVARKTTSKALKICGRTDKNIKTRDSHTRENLFFDYL